MKTREGFVSNSSSSSFVVKLREQKFEPTGKMVKSPWSKKPMPGFRQARTPSLLSPEQVKALEERGYKYTKHTYPSSLELGVKPRKASKERALQMYFQVTCNESDEVEFLVAQGVPFKATTHYGHHNVFWDGGDAKVYVADNIGMMLEMYWDSGVISKKRVGRVRSQTVESVKNEGWVK